MDFLSFLDKKIGSIRPLFDKLIESYHYEVGNLVQSDLIREKFLLSWILCFIKLNSYKNGNFPKQV